MQVRVLGFEAENGAVHHVASSVYSSYFVVLLMGALVDPVADLPWRVDREQLSVGVATPLLLDECADLVVAMHVPRVTAVTGSN